MVAWGGDRAGLATDKQPAGPYPSDGRSVVPGQQSANPGDCCVRPASAADDEKARIRLKTVEPAQNTAPNFADKPRRRIPPPATRESHVARKTQQTVESTR